MPSSCRKRVEFSLEEKKRIIKYVVEQEASVDVMGTDYWKTVAHKFPHHTWDILRNHFLRRIMPVLDKFDIPPDVVKRLREASTSRHTRRKNRGAYSTIEDKLIMSYVQKYPTADVGGNLLWQQMEEKEILKGRPWQGIRERFLKHLRKKQRLSVRRSSRIQKADAPSSSTSERLEDGQRNAANCENLEVVVPKRSKKKLFNFCKEFDGPVLDSPEPQRQLDPTFNKIKDKQRSPNRYKFAQFGNSQFKKSLPTEVVKCNSPAAQKPVEPQKQPNLSPMPGFIDGNFEDTNLLYEDLSRNMAEAADTDDDEWSDDGLVWRGECNWPPTKRPRNACILSVPMQIVEPESEAVQSSSNREVEFPAIPTPLNPTDTRRIGTSLGAEVDEELCLANISSYLPEGTSDMIPGSAEKVHLEAFHLNSDWNIESRDISTRQDCVRKGPVHSVKKMNHVSVQTDPVIVLPILEKSDLLILKKHIERSFPDEKCFSLMFAELDAL